MEDVRRFLLAYNANYKYRCALPDDIVQKPTIPPTYCFPVRGLIEYFEALTEHFEPLLGSKTRVGELQRLELGFRQTRLYNPDLLTLRDLKQHWDAYRNYMLDLLQPFVDKYGIAVVNINHDTFAQNVVYGMIPLVDSIYTDLLALSESYLSPYINSIMNVLINCQNAQDLKAVVPAVWFYGVAVKALNELYDQATQGDDTAREIIEIYGEDRVFRLRQMKETCSNL